MLVPGAAGFVDACGLPVLDTGLVPITLGGVQIGVLCGSDITGPGVLRLVASECASLVEVTRLRAELAGALREVEASRTRLIQATPSDAAWKGTCTTAPSSAWYRSGWRCELPSGSWPRVESM